jgi:hypothetical protein
MPLTDDGLGQNRGRSGAVSGNIRCFARYLFDHLGSKVLNFIF